MFDLVENWRKSDLSKKLFCENHGVNIHTFNYWIAKTQNEKMETGGFIRLQPSSFDSSYEITYPNGVKLCVKSADLATLSQLLKL